MADENQIPPSYVAVLSAARTVITLPEGFELVYYTLRRTSDGHIQSYQPMDVPPLFTEPPTAQLLNIPIRGGRERPTTADTDARTVSATTQKRHNQLLDNGYTIACGVVCPEVAPPVKKVNPGGGDFCCPRCLSNYTRPKSVKDHFPGCISRYGNPLGLTYRDHESMPSKDAALQSRESSSVSAEHNDMTDVDDQVIKTEFVFPADIPLESVEAQEQIPWSPNWRRASETPNPGHVMALTPPYGYGMDYVPGQTPSLESHGSRTPTPSSWHSGSATPTPAQQQVSNRTPTPASWSRSSTLSRDSSEETEGVDDGDSMEE